jgi:hypothetical protein
MAEKISNRGSSPGSDPPRLFLLLKTNGIDLP